MANGIYVANAVGVDTYTAAKTILEIGSASSTIRGTVLSWWVEFQGTSGSGTPIKVELVRATAGFTGGTAVTAANTARYTDKYDNPNYGYQIGNTASAANTTEGTATTVIESHYVHPQSGILVQYPLDREVQIPITGLLRIRVTSATAVLSTSGIVWQE
jgi:hypothetical protein